MRIGQGGNARILATTISVVFALLFIGTPLVSAEDIGQFSGKITNTPQFIQRTGCDSNGASADLQQYLNGVWVDVAPAKGRTATAGCNGNSGEPWIIVSLPVGTQVRWHIWAAGAWSLYSDPGEMTTPTTDSAGALGGPAPTAPVPEMPILQPCAFTQTLPCIQSFTLLDGKGKVLTATPRNAWTTSYIFGGQVFSGNLYDWNVPGLTQSNGNSDLIITAEYFPLKTPYCWLPNQAVSTCDYGADTIRVAITPSWRKSNPGPFHFPLLPDDKICGSKKSPQTCTPGWDLSENYKYQISLKMPEDFTIAMLVGEGKSGWLTKSTDSKGSKNVILIGTPAMKTYTLNSDLAPIADDQSKAVMGNVGLSFYIHSNKSEQAQWTNGCNGGDTLSFWRTSIIGNTPEWSKGDEAVQMQMGGPHFLADGTLNTGLFQIQVPISMAQCLWNVDLSKAVRATVQATYGSQGATEVVTTSEYVQKGYYVLTTAGFHYSSPTLKVKLKQDASGKVLAEAPVDVISEPEPILTAAPTGVATTIKAIAKPVAKNVTISCARGKTIKKVTGPKPTCPTGYIKK
ncbi:MAG: hypothetical protein WCJ91_07255 [Actinomycetes bacterium]